MQVGRTMAHFDVNRANNEEPSVTKQQKSVGQNVYIIEYFFTTYIVFTAL